MGWNNEEQMKNKGMDLSSKILLGIIACVILIIVIICILLLNVKTNTFTVSIDGVAKQKINSSLLTSIEDTTYVDIEAFSSLVGYEYHKGEYKSFTIQEDKCYVQGANETATFYLNDNKVCKLPVNQIEEDYQEYIINNTIKKVNDKMYAPIEAIKIAFNIDFKLTKNSLSITTLLKLVTAYDVKMKDWGYSSISSQDFENQKSILYGYIIVKKETGLYKIINLDNTKEIVSDKYNEIEFIENTKEFFVTNSLGKVGIINIDGTTKIEPIYDSIKVLDKKAELYLIEQDKKFGVANNVTTLIYPEYDKIGINTKNTNITSSQYFLLDTLIPVCKNNKYGAFDKNGNQVYKLEYDGFGCELTAIELNGAKKAVTPILTIEECDGIVVKQGNKYGLRNLKCEELVPTAVDSIYSIENTVNNEVEYFMLYNDEELNIIERLIKAGKIKETNNDAGNIQNTNNTTVQTTNITNTTSTNNINQNNTTPTSTANGVTNNNIEV